MKRRRPIGRHSSFSPTTRPRGRNSTSPRERSSVSPRGTGLAPRGHVETSPTALRVTAWGSALLALGKSSEAAQVFKDVLALDANHAGAHRNLGVALLAQMQIDAAIPCFMRAISIQPAFARAMADLGAAYLAKTTSSSPRHGTQAALALEPQQRAANRSMASILRRTGRDNEAKPYLDRASSKPPVYVEHAVDPARTVLVLWTSSIGNVPIVDFLFPLTSNTRINWVVESAHTDPNEDLPDYDLVFNATVTPMWPSTPPIRRSGSPKPAPSRC